jgi:hypothetical protein
LLQWQVHRNAARLRRLIQGENQLHGLSAFGAVDGGLLAREDRGDSFFEIGTMPSMADGLRVIGARAAAFGGRGDDRVVGPRPLLMRYVSRYSAFQTRRMEVKPGVTGWAQVNGRNMLSWEEKFALDVWYVDHRSFWLDMKIVVLTFFKVLARSGAERDKNVPPLEEFRGAEKQ